jgi:hypothetical protein
MLPAASAVQGKYINFPALMSKMAFKIRLSVFGQTGLEVFLLMQYIPAVNGDDKE